MTLRKTVIALVCLVIAVGPAPRVFAVSAPAGATEVDVPVTVASSSQEPIIGVDIYVRLSSGLQGVSFVPAAGNAAGVPVPFDSEGETLNFGTHADADRPIALSGGSLNVGILKCSYKGNAEERVSFEEVTIYRVAENGGMVSEALSESGALPADIPVTRGAGTSTPPSAGQSGGAVPDAGAGAAAPTSGGAVGTSPAAVADSALPGPEAYGAPSSGVYTFIDVWEAEWARTAIEYLATYKGIQGTGYGYFLPNAYVTRAQFARLLNQAFAFPAVTAPADFVDVPPGEWCYEDVTRLAAAGIIQGYDATSFRPNDLISREQMATMTDRALEYFGSRLEANWQNSVADLYVAASYAWFPIQKLYEAGLITGMEDGTFMPKSYTTRAQAAVIILRALRMTGKN